MSEPILKLIQLSDMHFTRFPTRMRDYFNKRIIGISNFLLKRRKEHSESLAEAIFPLLQLKSFDAVIICGDFTSTSLPREFAAASKWVKKLKDNRFKTYLIPGNHDCYTSPSEQEKRFYHHFPDPLPNADKKYSLAKHRVAYGKFSDHVWWVALDTAVSTSFFDSTGFFSEEAEAYLKTILSEHIPSEDFVVLINHYPLYPPKGLKHKHRSLRRVNALQRILREHPNVKLYLHGHNHSHKVIHKREANLPIAIDAGSLSSTKEGSWVSLEVFTDKVEVTPYFWDAEDFFLEKKWLIGEKETFYF